MKIKRLKVELSEAQGQFAKAAKAVKTAATRSASLKANVRDSKRAFKESRRTYKQVRGFLKTATREERQAEKILKKASTRLNKLRAKTKKLQSKSAKVAPKAKQQPATKRRARSAIAVATKEVAKPAVIQTLPAQTPRPAI